MFYHMSLLILYKSIYYVFIANANKINAKLRKKVQKYCFFILYNNTNFYKRLRNI